MWTLPPRVGPGDTVAVVSPSWGGPHAFPHVYEAGLTTLKRLGLQPLEMPYTRARAATPAQRASDLTAALLDDRVRMIVASIGGDDGVRVLRHLDPQLVRAHPKVVLGFSDTCALLLGVVSAGVVAFHGPSVMAGLAQAPALPPRFLDDLCTVIFRTAQCHVFRPYGVFADLYPTWTERRNATAVKELIADDGPHWLQGSRPARGRAIGGCLEVVEMLKGTPYWPAPERWDRAVVFLEGSEEQPPPVLYRRVLRSWAAAELLDSVSALMIGRAQGLDATAKRQLDEQIVAFAREELERPDLVVVTNVDIGHTAPQWTLPIGGLIELDPVAREIRLLEPAVACPVARESISVGSTRCASGPGRGGPHPGA
jgi:muramoyltetrapeptide carboxypeptidase LdcA involved in peptidoglycan recycling